MQLELTQRPHESEDEVTVHFWRSEYGELTFEAFPGLRTVWLLSIHTEEKYRQRGFARQLLEKVFAAMPRSGLCVPGICTEEGERLRGCIARLSDKYGIRIEW